METINKRYHTLRWDLQEYKKHYQNALKDESQKLWSMKASERDYLIYNNLKETIKNIQTLLNEINEAIINNDGVIYYNHPETIRNYNIKFNNILS